MARWWRRDSATTADDDAQSEASSGVPTDAGVEGASASGADAGEAVPAWQQVEPLRPVVASALSGETASEPLEFVRTLSSRWQQAPAVAPLGHDVRPEVMGGVVGGIVAAVPSSTQASDAELPELRWASPIPPAVVSDVATAVPAPSQWPTTASIPSVAPLTGAEPLPQNTPAIASTQAPNAVSVQPESGQPESGQPAPPGMAVPARNNTAELAPEEDIARPAINTPIPAAQPEQPLAAEPVAAVDPAWLRPGVAPLASGDTEAELPSAPAASSAPQSSRPLVSGQPLAGVEPLIDIRRPISTAQQPAEEAAETTSNGPLPESPDRDGIGTGQVASQANEDETTASSTNTPTPEALPARPPTKGANIPSFVDDSVSTTATSAEPSTQNDQAPQATPPTIGPGLGPILRQRRSSVRPVEAEDSEPNEPSEPLPEPLATLRKPTPSPPPGDELPAVQAATLSGESAPLPRAALAALAADDTAPSSDEALDSTPLDSMPLDSGITSAPLLAGRALPAPSRGIVSRPRPSLEPQLTEPAELPPAASPEPPSQAVAAMASTSSSQRINMLSSDSPEPSMTTQIPSPGATVTYTAQGGGVNGFTPTPSEIVPQMVGHSIPAGVLAQAGSATGQPSGPASGSESPHPAENAADPEHLDRLADQLYGRLRSQLASELLVGRERSQMLTDL